MGGYIGARAGTLSTTVANVQDVTATDTTPEVTIINNTHEDTDGGREGKVIFKGQQSGGEETTLAEIQGSHDGTADDEKGDLIFKTNDGNDGASPTEAMRIDSSGNVGIGTSSPNAPTAIVANTTTYEGLELVTPTGDGSGEFHIGVHDNGGTGGRNIVFSRGGSDGMDTESMRIDSSGNVLVGKTAANNTAAGHVLYAGGLQAVVKDGGTAQILNRLSSDGTIVDFRKDGSTVGSIGSLSGTDLYISGSRGAGLRFTDAEFFPVNATGQTSDNTIDLGHSVARYDDIYATNGTIQTSDENEKQQIASLTSAEITAATAISKLFKTFKWKDKVAAKGDNARTHTGVVAQQVQTAMSDAGLDAGNYAFFISTTWWETQTEVPAVEADEKKGIEAADAYTRTDTYQTKDDAPEGATERNRKGIRYPELLAFIGAATEQRLTSIESRLTALEAG